MRNAVRKAWIVIVLFAIAAGANAGVLVLPANEILSNPPGDYHWWGLEHVFADDGVYAIDTVFSNKLDTFRIAFADPGDLDTMHRVITNVSLYADNRVHYSKGGKLLLYAVYDGWFGDGTRSRVLKVGYAETVNQHDITLHDTIASVFPDGMWHWGHVTGLGMIYQPRTTGIIYYVDHVFAVVTFRDTLQSTNYRFAFAPVPGPQTVGVPFPVTVAALDSLGDTLTTYNESASLWDSKGEISPVFVSFTNGISTFNAVITDTALLDTLFIGDGTAIDTSNGFAVELGGVRNFDFDSIGAKTAGVAFAVTIRAANYFGDPVTSFTDAVALWDATGTHTPITSPAFSNGACTYSATVSQQTPADVVYCSHALGAGQSNAFVVGPPLGAAGAPAAGRGEFRAAFAPNPSSSDLALDLNLPRAGRVTVAAYNILGQPIQEMDYGSRQAGQHRLPWRHGAAMSGGVYFFTIDLDGTRMEVRKLLVVR